MLRPRASPPVLSPPMGRRFHPKTRGPSRARNRELRRVERARKKEARGPRRGRSAPAPAGTTPAEPASGGLLGRLRSLLTGAGAEADAQVQVLAPARMTKRERRRRRRQRRKERKRREAARDDRSPAVAGAQPLPNAFLAGATFLGGPLGMVMLSLSSIGGLMEAAAILLLWVAFAAAVLGTLRLAGWSARQAGEGLARALEAGGEAASGARSPRRTSSAEAPPEGGPEIRFLPPAEGGGQRDGEGLDPGEWQAADRVVADQPLTVDAAGEDARPACPFCACALAEGVVVRCRACSTPHHEDCWRTAGRCTTYACGSKRFVPVGEG